MMRQKEASSDSSDCPMFIPILWLLSRPKLQPRLFSHELKESLEVGSAACAGSNWCVYISVTSSLKRFRYSVTFENFFVEHWGLSLRFILPRTFAESQEQSETFKMAPNIATSIKATRLSSSKKPQTVLSEVDSIHSLLKPIRGSRITFVRRLCHSIRRNNDYGS